MYVPGEGNRDTQIAFVGEAPGRWEAMSGRPFVGASGEQLEEALRHCGLRRSDVYITNTIKDSTATPTDEEIADKLPELIMELAALPKCNIFVALGSVALKALGAWRYNSITRMRGSIIETVFGAKMLATVHPAWYMRGEWRYKPIMIADIKRAVAESEFPEIRRPNRTYIIEPTFEQAVEKLREYQSAKELSFDIETFGNYIACIGFGPSPHEAICIPIMRRGLVPYWSPEQEAAIWLEIAATLGAPSRKIAQNGMFDIGKLAEHGVEVRNFAFDTMLAHHLLLPELPHGLDFICSIYASEPYYKDEGKTWTHQTDDRQLWTYNLKDVTSTFEAKMNLEADLVEEGMQIYFDEYVMPLTIPLLDMQQRGLLIDRDKLWTAKARLEAKVRQEQNRLNDMLGWSMNVKGAKDCSRLLAQFNIKPTRFTTTGRVKLDEETLRTYAARYPHDAWDLLFSIREMRTLISGFLNLKTDDAGYYHPSYLIHGTRSGRLSSRGSGEGPQIQNVPKDARDIFIAAPGREFINADLKQAEAMVVAWLAEDPLMIEFFLKRLDIHKFYASIIFGKPEALITKSEREAAKRIEHGTNYGMKPRKLTMILRNEGIYISEREAQRYQDMYFDTFPRIKEYHKNVESTVRRARTITTCFGRKRVFLGLFDDNLVREAISFEPQSTVVEVTNRALLHMFNNMVPEGRIVAQVHDAVMIETPQQRREEALALVRQAFNQTLVIKGRKLTIPIEISTGPTWGALREV